MQLTIIAGAAKVVEVGAPIILPARSLKASAGSGATEGISSRPSSEPADLQVVIVIKVIPITDIDVPKIGASISVIKTPTTAVVDAIDPVPVVASVAVGAFQIVDAWVSNPQVVKPNVVVASKGVGAPYTHSRDVDELDVWTW